VAEAEAGVMKLNLAPTDFDALVRESVDLYEHVAEDKSIQIEVVSRPNSIGVVDPQRVRLVLANLLDNALKYTHDGGHVRIMVDRMDGMMVVQIEDDGMGIALSDLDKIWDRLYRADKSRSQRGLGLGLSLVKAIVEAHRGVVRVKSEPGKGSIFMVAFKASGFSEEPTRLPGPSSTSNHKG
jgi:signal transduction histidine kinase